MGSRQVRIALPHTYVKSTKHATSWMSTRTRGEANTLLGAPFAPCRDESLNPDPCPHAMPASAGTVIVPAFNMADEGDSTQASLSAVIGKVYGIKTGFQGMLKGFLASMNMVQIAEVSCSPELSPFSTLGLLVDIGK
jgi:hypothetical protein